MQNPHSLLCLVIKGIKSSNKEFVMCQPLSGRATFAKITTSISIGIQLEIFKIVTWSFLDLHNNLGLFHFHLHDFDCKPEILLNNWKPSNSNDLLLSSFYAGSWQSYQRRHFLSSKTPDAESGFFKKWQRKLTTRCHFTPGCLFRCVSTGSWSMLHINTKYNPICWYTSQGNCGYQEYYVADKISFCWC